MKKFVLDTNIFIHAIRDAVFSEELAAWQRVTAPRIHMHAVVASELLVGARDEVTWARWHERVVAPAERVKRIVVPTYGDWLNATRIITRLVKVGAIAGGIAHSFYNDCLLAASCRSQGLVIISHNLTDFELIARVEPSIEVIQPFP